MAGVGRLKDCLPGFKTSAGFAAASEAVRGFNQGQFARSQLLWLRLFPRQAHRLEQGFRGWVRQQSPYTENVNVAVGPCPEPLLCKRRTPYCRSNLAVLRAAQTRDIRR